MTLEVPRSMNRNEVQELKHAAAECCLGCAHVNSRLNGCGSPDTASTPYRPGGRFNVYGYSICAFEHSLTGSITEECMPAACKCPLYRRAGT